MAGFFDSLTKNLNPGVWMEAISRPEVDLIGGVGNPLNQSGVGGQSVGELSRNQSQMNILGAQHNTNLQRTLSGKGPELTPLGGGQVQSATDISSLPSGGGQDRGFLQSLLNHAGGAVQNQYNSALGILDQNRQALQGQANRGISDVDRLYGQQEQGFQNQLQGAEKDLARSESQIRENRGEALSDLTSDLRAQMDSFTRMIGAMGAADSSAAGMGQYAFGRMGQQARADIWNQANKLISEVGYRREKVKDQFRQNMTELQNWKTNTLQSIQSDLQDKLSQLDAAKMQATADRQAQLDALKQQVYQEALTTAMDIDQRVIQMSSANENWAKQQTQTLGDVESRIAQSLQQIQVDPIAAGELSTGVENQFAFGAGDIIRNTPGQMVGGQPTVALPTNRRDERAI